LSSLKNIYNTFTGPKIFRRVFYVQKPVINNTETGKLYAQNNNSTPTFPYDWSAMS